MSDGKEHGELKESLDELLQLQAQVEQSAFDAINEHDRYLNLLHAAMEQIQEMLGGLEMLDLEIGASLVEFQESQQLLPAAKQLSILHEQNSQTAGELARVLEELQKEAETGNEVIHQMEEDIAQAQDALKKVCNIAAGD